MIDLKDFRHNPERYIEGARSKQVSIDFETFQSLDKELRSAMTRQQELTAEKNRLGKEIGQLAGQLKKATGEEKAVLEARMKETQMRPAAIKDEENSLAELVRKLEAQRLEIWLKIPQPADEDVPVGASSDDNVELRRWVPEVYDPALSFEDNRGFKPRTHIELCEMHGLVDYPRGVKMAGSRSYVLSGAGMALHNAVLQFAFRTMTEKNGFTAMSVPVLVREECMTGTGFFPGGRDQAYLVSEKERGGGTDLYLTGTGEVGLMGFHQDEILDEDSLPRQYTTLSTCFRREAGAAGRDTAGLYRIHQFDKVEQVVICKADKQESRKWHQTMLGYVEDILKQLELPYRLLQCCTGDLGMKNADMIDVECWMPGRGQEDDQGRPLGDWGETHSASRLYDYQCRRLNMRYKTKNADGKTETHFCHSLNNTVAASPRILIPLLEIHQQEDGSIRIPDALQPYLGGIKVLTPNT